MEFLVDLRTVIPAGTDDAELAATFERENERVREMAGRGELLRLWRPPAAMGERRALGLFAAQDEARLQALLASLPLFPWMTVRVTPLGSHPSDPGG